MNTDWAEILKAVESLEREMYEWIAMPSNSPGRQDLLRKVAVISHATSDRYIHERVDRLSMLVSHLFSGRNHNTDRTKRRIRDACGEIRAYRISAGE
jgi:hypothetical protein